MEGRERGREEVRREAIRQDWEYEESQDTRYDTGKWGGGGKGKTWGL